jgi:hypothetical protein
MPAGFEVGSVGACSVGSRRVEPRGLRQPGHRAGVTREQRGFPPVDEHCRRHRPVADLGGPFQGLHQPCAVAGAVADLAVLVRGELRPLLRDLNDRRTYWAACLLQDVLDSREVRQGGLQRHH